MSAYNGRIYTRSGILLDVLNIGKWDVPMSDIFGPLSQLCRFNGQCDTYYSVAEHSCLAAILAKAWRFPAHVQLAALLHDAHEAFIGDVASPHKDLIAGWREFEGRVERGLRCALGLDPDDEATWRAVGTVDKALVHREALSLFFATPTWVDHNRANSLPPEVQPLGLLPSQAQALMESLYQQLIFEVAALDASK